MPQSTPPPSGAARYIHPLTDFGFKRIFGTEANKDLLIDFLNTVLDVEGGIRELRYDNSEAQGRKEFDRKAIFDLHCITGKGEHIIVEMQNVRQKYFKDRVLYYATFPIQTQGEKGRRWNFKLAPVYSISIINFPFDDITADREKYASYVQLIDRDDHHVFYDKLAFVFFELPRFAKPVEALTGNVERWMYVLKHLSELQELPEALRNRVFQKLFRVAEIAKMTPEERKYYDQSLKTYRDMYLIETELENAREELKSARKYLKNKDAELMNLGAELKSKDDALKSKDAVIRNSASILLEAGVSVQKIAESTGLSLEEIKEIRKNLN